MRTELPVPSVLVEHPPAPTWFVYYKVAVVDLEAVMGQLQACRQALAVQGLAIGAQAIDFQVMRRPEVVDGCCTLMEVYRPVDQAGTKDPAAASETSIAAAIAQAASSVAPWLIGSRHVEQFIPCA
jgi:hypothetical protein